MDSRPNFKRFSNCHENLDNNVACDGCDVSQNLKSVKLERVLGFTIPGNASLRCEPNSGLVVYPAGCVVVLYNPRKNKQTHILNASKKTITCLDVSVDGKYVVTGECGHLPNVRVWDIQEKVQVAEFSGHKYGVNCVAFSPNLKYVVSVGSQHDMIVNVWDWKSGVKLASNKVSSKVKAVAFAENGTYFVTVGNRHVKFWYLECAARPSKYKEPVPLMGRSAILGEKRNNCFCDVACGKGDIAGSAFSITKSGLLCEFNNRRLLDKWVELRTSSANCIAVSKAYVLIGCADGIVRCFNPYTLEFITTLPRTHYLGVDIAMGLSISHMAQVPTKAKYPDTVAITYDEVSKKITCVYSDHSLYIWDAKDIKKIGKSHSFLYHSACIWGIESYPLLADSHKPTLPPGSFVTCSSDDTIRIWNLDPNMPNNTMYRKNIYCNELLKIMYVDEGLSYICDSDRNSCGSNDKMDATYDTKNGVRCLRISPSGQHLASGDRSGNIRIHHLQRMDEICKIEAHDAEVLNLEYTKPDTGHRLLASASRDRLIHVFDVDQDYSFQQTLDDHSSSITAVRFVQSNNQTQMISCGADKSIIFRTAQFNPQLQFIRDHHVVGKTTLYDMEVDFEQKHILTACQDRHVRVYSVGSGRHIKSFKGSLGEDGTLIKIVIDQSGLFAATSGTDKNLCIYDFSTGECVATMFGHSELVTGLRFTNDCKHLISVSGDGCIFIWKLPLEITHQMEVRLAQVAPKMKLALRKPSSPHRATHSPDVNEFEPANKVILDANANTKGLDDSNSPGYRFSIGTLPKWAKKELSDDVRSVNTTTEKSALVAQPKGRWAQRVDTQGLVVRSFYSSDHVIPYPNQVLKTSSQITSETKEIEYRNYSDRRRETILISRQQESHQDFVPCPESIDQIRFGEIRSSNSSPPTITTKRGQNYTISQRLPSDSSTTGSICQDYDLEGEQYNDADGEDEESLESGELDGEIIYYPQSDEIYNIEKGDFKVKATNPEELRDAHRRLRKGRAERPSDLPIITVHDSDEEEDPGTPQGNERNLLSMLNGSMESLDRVNEREKFLKSNYESLDGDTSGFKEEETSSTTTGLGSSLTDEGEQGDDHRQSFSARFLHQSTTPKNENPPSVLNSPIQKVEASSRRRQEIMLQLEQSRRKLDLIGWKATMHSSKSIGDLTELPEKDYPGGKSLSSQDAALESMRRASSMNDLSKPRRLLPSPPTYDVPSAKSPAPRVSDAHLSRSSTAMSRSSSMGTLNPNESDSDAGSVNDTSKPTTLSRWNRPTISSSNKSVGGRGSLEKLNGQPVPPLRRGAAQTLIEKRKAMAVDSVRSHALTDSSSGGEASPTEPRAPPHYTSTLPRNHGKAASSLSQPLFARSRSEKDLSKTGIRNSPSPSPRKETSTPTTPVKIRNDHYDQRSVHTNLSNYAPRPYVKTSNGVQSDVRDGDMLEKSPQDLPVKDYLPQPVDVITAPLTHELCDYTAQGLKQSADNMVQLYKRIAMDADLTVGEREEMLNILSDGIIQAQQTLKPIHPGIGASNLNPSGFNGKSSALEGPRNWKVINSIPTAIPKDEGGKQGLESMQLLQQYSDMLMNMMQQKMSSQPS